MVRLAVRLLSRHIGHRLNRFPASVLYPAKSTSELRRSLWMSRHGRRRIAARGAAPSPGGGASLFPLSLPPDCPDEDFLRRSLCVKAAVARGAIPRVFHSHTLPSPASRGAFLVTGEERIAPSSVYPVAPRRERSPSRSLRAFLATQRRCAACELATSPAGLFVRAVGINLASPSYRRDRLHPRNGPRLVRKAALAQRALLFRRTKKPAARKEPPECGIGPPFVGDNSQSTYQRPTKTTRRARE